MPAFYYEASDLNGKIYKHIIEADSIKHARALLREKGLITIEIKTSFEKNNTTYIKKKVSQRYIIDFTRQFATLFAAGLPIDQILSLLSKDTEEKNLQQIISQIRADINEGQTLSSALSEHRYIFSNLYIALIEAGEESGKLDVIMLELADYIENQQKLKEQIQHAFIYPIILTIISFSIIIFLMTYIIPKVVDVFESRKQSLPILTQIMLSISNFLTNYGIYILIFGFISILLGKYLIAKPFIIKKLDNLYLKMPIIKKLSLGYNSARFSNTLSILTKSGIPILRSLKAGANIITNTILKQQVINAIEDVKQGSTLSNALKSSSFPVIMIQLIKTGENTGQLANILEKISQQQTSNLRRYTLFLTTLLEPLLILFMGAMVMLIVLSVLLPIIQLNQAVF